MDNSEETSRPRSRLIFLLPVAAVAVAALTAWRMANPRTNSGQNSHAQLRMPAPTFTLYDQGSENVKPRMVNLGAYLHRYRILVVFYDGQEGPESDPTLLLLRRFHAALEDAGVVVFGVSTALPQENRNRSTQPFPFRLLSDVTPFEPKSVHRTWGRLAPPAAPGEPPGTIPGAFVIDRAGRVAWEGNHPKPDESPDTLVSRLLRG